MLKLKTQEQTQYPTDEELNQLFPQPQPQQKLTLKLPAQSIQQQLDEPFPDQYITLTPSKYDTTILKFVDYKHYIQRLDSIFNKQWSLTIQNYTILETSVTVHVRLTLTFADGTRHAKDAFGTSVRRLETPGDDLKNASMDGFRRAAAMFGLGRHLYEKQQPPMIANDSKVLITNEKLVTTK